MNAMVNVPLLFCAFLWCVAMLLPERDDDGKALLFLLGAATYVLALIFELTRVFGG